MVIKIRANLNHKSRDKVTRVWQRPDAFHSVGTTVVKTGDSAEHCTNLNKCHLMLNDSVI